MVHHTTKISKCCILTSDPTKHAIPKTAEVYIPLAWASLADNITRSLTPSHIQPFLIKWEVYFSKRIVSLVFIIVSLCSECICIWVYNTKQELHCWIQFSVILLVMSGYHFYRGELLCCYVISSLYLKVNKWVKNQEIEKFLWRFLWQPE